MSAMPRRLWTLAAVAGAEHRGAPTTASELAKDLAAKDHSVVRRDLIWLRNFGYIALLDRALTIASYAVTDAGRRWLAGVDVPDIREGRP